MSIQGGEMTFGRILLIGALASAARFHYSVCDSHLDRAA